MDIICVFSSRIFDEVAVLDTVKPVLSGHSKIDKTKILMTNGSLMKAKSTAECSLHYGIIGIENHFCSSKIFLSGGLRQILLYMC